MVTHTIYKGSPPFISLFTDSTFPPRCIMSLSVEPPSSSTMQYSPTSSVTRISEDEEVNVPKNEIEKALEVDWENDPDNARNWSFGRKWTAVAIVSTSV